MTIMDHQKTGNMFFLFALLSASSFKVPNALSITIEYGAIDATTKKGTISVEASGLTHPTPSTSNTFVPVTVKLVYTPPSPGVSITLTKPNVAVNSGTLDTCDFEIDVADTGSATVFQHAVKYTLTSVEVGADTRTPVPATDDFTPTIPTLALTYEAATGTTYTLTATFTDDQTGDKTVTFNPTTTTEKAVEVILAFGTTGSKTATATLTVGEAGSTTVFKIGEKYKAAAVTGYRTTGDEWTPANPLTTTYASKLEPIDEEKKDGAKDPIKVTCTNAMIKGALIEGDNKTRTLVLTEGTSTPITLAYVENKVNFTITDGQCVVSYVFNDAKIEKGKTGKAQLNLGTTAFLEGDLTFDGSKSVASIIAALLAVLALVF
ncbi:hypothetical protein BLNAU_13483 [Blattamonas nauphoetae]|uniref:Uncharacterized protein n=1 Tax=Blattamonas nauphoetae TaxID=2049346 RepID=A0ABQ9XJF2_9EUKA|nr:hypothetical protein BLNAU_13483 [Blattamonas nauphoetae]